MAFPFGIIVGRLLKLSGRAYSDGFIDSALATPGLLVAIVAAFLAHTHYIREKSSHLNG